MRNMDYFAQKPDLDLQSFFEAKGLRMADRPSDRPIDKPIQPAPGAAPPPKDTAWVAIPDEDDRQAN